MIGKDGRPDRLHVTAAKPGHLHIFGISADAARPKRLASIPTAGGAHHVAYTKDGSIALVDLAKGEAVGSIDTLKDRGAAPNSIVLLPRWNEMAGH